MSRKKIRGKDDKAAIIAVTPGSVIITTTDTKVDRKQQGRDRCYKGLCNTVYPQGQKSKIGKYPFNERGSSDESDSEDDHTAYLSYAIDTVSDLVRKRCAAP